MEHLSDHSTFATPPIDIVYLWCDGSDEKWIKLRNETANMYGVSLKSEENGACRISSSNELKYSLRSMDMHCPWIRKVFIIVPDVIQLPEWLNCENSRLRIVRESEIVPAEYCPCFCSPTIEHHIGFIPDLAEYFLYSNDDMFFYRDLATSFFYDSCGLPIVRIHAYDFLIPHNNYDLSLINAFNLIGKRNNAISKDERIILGKYPHHGIDSYRKSHYIATYNKYKEDYIQSFSIPFRSDNDIQRMIYLWEEIISYGASFKYVGFPTHDSDSVAFGTQQWGDGYEIVSHIKPGLVCFNSDDFLNEGYSMWLKMAMDILFPVPSSFEKQ